LSQHPRRIASTSASISPGTRRRDWRGQFGFPEEGADAAHHRPAEIRHLVRIDHADGFEYANRKGADDCIACALDARRMRRNRRFIAIRSYLDCA
jgi:hypothetical protein